MVTAIKRESPRTTKVICKKEAEKENPFKKEKGSIFQVEEKTMSLSGYTLQKIFLSIKKGDEELQVQKGIPIASSLIDTQLILLR